MRPRPRPGFALADLLVMLALLLLLLAVALPMVQQARAAADRAQCAANLKRLGQALRQHADDHQGGLPPIGGITNPSLFVRLLPYLEHHDLATKLSASGVPWYDPANTALVKKHLPVMQCPAAPNPDRLITGTIQGTDYQAAPTDYNGINQITNAVAFLFPDDLDRTAALHNSESQKLSTITDGLSNTLFGVVEIADKPNAWRAGKLSKTRDGNPIASGSWAANSFNSPRGYSADGTTAPGPCAMNCSNSAAIYSFHPDGCNFLFADGGVRFLNKDLDVWVMYAVITRRGGEIVAPSDF